MSVQDTLTWDLATAMRPGLSDVVDGTKVNDGDDPPDDVSMPNAHEHNQMAAQIAAFAKVVPSARISVSQTTGTYAITNVQSCGSNVTSGSFTLTKNATGDVSLTWTAGVLPATTGQPMATVNEDAALIVRAFNVSNGVRVKLVNTSGAATDGGFTVLVY